MNAICQSSGSIAADCQRNRALCSACPTPSAAVYSRYQRQPADLPAGGKIVRLKLTILLFYYRSQDYPGRTFAESCLHLVVRYAHRTRRLAEV